MNEDNLYFKFGFIYLITFVMGAFSYFLWSINKHTWSVLVCVIVFIPIMIYYTYNDLL